MDVASLLRLNIRRRGDVRVYADCPLCGDRRGRLGLYPRTNSWHCFHCGERGGILPLYSKVHGVSYSEAYQEICDALAIDGFSEGQSTAARPVKEVSPKTAPPERAPVEDIHRTLTALLSLLTLTPTHREHLRTVRGLTDEEIDHFGFKSTPTPRFCRSLTDRLIQQGFRVQGVPGFYVNGYGKWTVKFHTRTSGILIPLRGVDGLLRGLQIRLDRPLRREDDPPDKPGSKYLPLTSTGKSEGVSSGTPIHFVGDPHARVVYVTEGALKADIAHALTGRTFVATMGANNTNGLDELFSFLRRNGTEEIIEAEDMDKYRNEGVYRGACEIQRLAGKHGLACRHLNWNPNYKGIDDWQLSLRRRRTGEKEPVKMSFKEMYLAGMCVFDHIEQCINQWYGCTEDDEGMADFLGLTAEEYKMLFTPETTMLLQDVLNNQRYCQHYRIYQLNLNNGVVPFAFAGIQKMREANYEQPPASLYQLVYDGAMFCPNEQNTEDVLNRIFALYSEETPKDFPGRNTALSDVIELYGENGRAYFYCDKGGFIGVRFSPMLAKPLTVRT